MLHISPTHKEVLDKALKESIVPIDINVDQFQAMIENISSSHPVTIIENDVIHNKLDHNYPLCLDIFLHNTKIRRVLIDGGAGLNICH